MDIKPPNACLYIFKDGTRCNRCIDSSAQYCETCIRLFELETPRKPWLTNAHHSVVEIGKFQRRMIRETLRAVPIGN